MIVMIIVGFVAGYFVFSRWGTVRMHNPRGLNREGHTRPNELQTANTRVRASCLLACRSPA
jgi:hypothetical protein